MNRVTDKIARTKKIVAERIALNLITPEKVEENRKIADMDMEMYCDFQNRKSIASQDGTLSLEEAQTIYGYLGNTLDHFNAQPFEVKYTLTMIYQELIAKAMRKRGLAG